MFDVLDKGSMLKPKRSNSRSKNSSGETASGNSGNLMSFYTKEEEGEEAVFFEGDVYFATKSKEYKKYWLVLRDREVLCYEG
mmetsp:Transcript_5243/g.3961  ORF Transcript_5243/g.3961 Transcript_5243/m.3961 type:complete len:82 (-) Transcript_5243:279-524(-)|eukprot:CAMPEP_0202956224 /NCGR_PEP_ID=MMETSP1396-20130829/746_1 /ASSEMBLY_ACC=CAM_ASM_000872 /TAXON_ID= /ORGANISM="Pseudokeronopsis sp., Strain Brazil" /LENGTH=81 /DNA_ID=CAMNT_0049673145 /DNA_START=1203 /DNA_END=1448 /DNA_ORIENTATION=-